MNCSPPGSSVHGIFQAKILEGVAVSSSRGSSCPRDRTHVIHVSCIGRWILYHCATWNSGTYTWVCICSMHVFGDLIFQQLEPDIEQQTGSKLAKEFIKVIYSHLAYLTFMQSTSWEMPVWIQHKLESRLLWEIKITFNMQLTGEGNGNPLQYSCLENPRDRGAWWAAVYGVTQSQTRLM